jgi:murein DD-endopeptidase MepM/ murein hydrolase activator NlpD
MPRSLQKTVLGTLLIMLSLVGCSGAGATSSPDVSIRPDGTVVSSWKNTSFPVENFQKISSPYGWRTGPTSGKREFHNGIDLAAPHGSYVRNWADGLVTDVSYDRRCGWRVEVNSGAWEHVYCHLSGIGVRKGQYVKAGQTIAAVGETGHATGPHLHWTLRYNQQLIDPSAVIYAMRQAWSLANK